jgi:hypothetical protein
VSLVATRLDFDMNLSGQCLHAIVEKQSTDGSKSKSSGAESAVGC